MIPYVACGIVAIGMLAHFLITVTRFITRRENEELAAGDVVRGRSGQLRNDRSSKGAAAAKSSGGFNWSLVGLPALAVALFAVDDGLFVPSAQAAGQRPSNRDGPGPLRPLAGRRSGPRQAARYAGPQLLAGDLEPRIREVRIRGHREGKKRKKVARLSAVEWMLEVITGSDRSHEVPVIRIDHPEVRKIFELQAAARPLALFGQRDAAAHPDRFEQQVTAASKLDPEDLTVEQRQAAGARHAAQEVHVAGRGVQSPRDLPELPTRGGVRRSDRALADRKVQAASAWPFSRAPSASSR